MLIILLFYYHYNQQKLTFREYPRCLSKSVMKDTGHEVMSYLQVTREMNITQFLRFQQMAW